VDEGNRNAERGRGWCLYTPALPQLEGRWSIHLTPPRPLQVHTSYLRSTSDPMRAGALVRHFFFLFFRWAEASGSGCSPVTTCSVIRIHTLAIFRLVKNNAQILDTGTESLAGPLLGSGLRSLYNERPGVWVSNRHRAHALAGPRYVRDTNAHTAICLRSTLTVPPPSPPSRRPLLLLDLCSILSPFLLPSPAEKFCLHLNG